MTTSNSKKIAIFASGSGSNAQKIMEYFQDNENIKVEVLLANKPNIGALERAEKFGVPTLVFNKEQFVDSNEIVDFLKEKEIDLIVLAGFLWLIPENLVNAFPNQIINIHPALLPKYGGKGMYGANVHKAVVENKEKESGMTIHYVNQKYDEGKVIFQSSCTIDSTDGPTDVAKKVLELEHKYFAKVIEDVLNNKS